MDVLGGSGKRLGVVCYRSDYHMGGGAGQFSANLGNMAILICAYYLFPGACILKINRLYEEKGQQIIIRRKGLFNSIS